MNEHTLELVRFKFDADAVFGVLLLPGYGQYATVECPWIPKDAAGKAWAFGLDKKSCIPAGTYTLELHPSPTWKKPMWYILGEGVALRPSSRNPIEWRESVMLHPANKASELQACIAPGMFYDPIGRAVRESQKAMSLINSHLHKLASPRLRITNALQGGS